MFEDLYAAIILAGILTPVCYEGDVSLTGRSERRLQVAQHQVAERDTHRREPLPIVDVEAT